QIREFIHRFGHLYIGVVLLNDREVWGKGVSQKCREACEAVGIPLITEVEEKDNLDKDRLKRLSNIFVKILLESS
ncbi:MAG: hypothetical protein JSW01_04490, partial [Candidatus Bathyarchaeota archaeon]